MAGERLGPSDLSLDSRSLVWRPSDLTPLEKVISPDWGITREGLERFDRYMYAFGTSEAKMATLVFGVTPNPQTAPEIYRRLEIISPSTWLPPVNIVRTSHLRESLCQTGLAECCEEDRYVLFRTTPEGENPGKLIASYLLAYATSTSVSLNDYLGCATTRSGSRAHINRSAILLHLSLGESYAAEIVKVTGMHPPVVGSNAKDLSRLGLIDYKAVTTSESRGWGGYRLIGNLDLVEHSSTRDRVRRNVVAYFRENPEGNVYSIASSLSRRDKHDIYRILNELVNQGILERTGYHGGVRQSYAKITPAGTEFVETLLLPVLRACSDDSACLSAADSAYQRVLANQALATHALELYAKASPGVNRRSASKVESMVVDLINKRGAVRYEEIIKTIGGGAGEALRQLVNSGRLQKSQDGKAVFYHLPDYEKKPTLKKTVVVYQYTLSTDITPRKERPRQDYLHDLETAEFWSGLLEDLSRVPAGITERVFYYRYDPENPAWDDHGNFRSGKYMNYIIAFRKLGIANPYELLQQYVPQDQRVIDLVKSAQAKISQSLIPSRPAKRFEKAIQLWNQVEFWHKLKDDLVAFDPGASFRSFLLYFSSDNPSAKEFAQGASATRMYGPDRFIWYWCMAQWRRLCELPVFKRVPLSIRDDPRKAMVAFIYTKAPEDVKALLLEKFPLDLGEIVLTSCSGAKPLKIKEKSRLMTLLRTVKKILLSREAASYLSRSKKHEQLVDLQRRLRSLIIISTYQSVEKRFYEGEI